MHRVTQDLPQHRRRFLLDVRAQRGEGGGQHQRLGAALADRCADPFELAHIQSAVGVAVEQRAAVGQEDLPIDRLAQLRRPAQQRRHAVAARQGQAHHRDPRQVPAFEEGVEQLGGAQHHRGHRRRFHRRLAQQFVDRRRHAVADRRSGGALQGAEHFAAAHQHGVGIGAADIDADAQRRGVLADHGLSPQSERDQTT